MPRFQLSRRALLAGLGGVALSSPLLQIFGEREARAQVTAPLRYLVVFAGMSGGRANVPNVLVPGSVGNNFQIGNSVLQPLVNRNVKDRVSVVSNLRMGRNNGAAGAAGFEWHSTSVGPLLSGARFNGPGTNTPAPAASTSDQIVADAWNQQAPIRAVHYRVQSSAYRGGTAKGIISHRYVNGTRQANEPVVNAKLAYDALVSKVTPTDPAELAKLEHQTELRRSALVGLKDKQSLLDRLGKTDRERLQQHFDELSAFEASLGSLASTAAACTAPKSPTDNTAIVDNYSGEKERALRLAELIKFGFSCDLTRVATLCVTFAQSFLGTNHLIPSGLNSDCHETSHNGPVQSFREVIQWHVDVFAYLVQQLRNTPDVGGTTLLDNTAVVYLFEGGQGNDPQAQLASSPHSSENMVALAAGRAVGNRPGAHINGNGRHPASLLLTAMKNVGIQTNQLGDITTTIPEFVL